MSSEVVTVTLVQIRTVTVVTDWDWDCGGDGGEVAGETYDRTFSTACAHKEQREEKAHWSLAYQHLMARESVS